MQLKKVRSLLNGSEMQAESLKVCCFSLSPQLELASNLILTVRKIGQQLCSMTI